jgi:hypothetical protein
MDPINESSHLQVIILIGSSRTAAARDVFQRRISHIRLKVRGDSLDALRRKVIVLLITRRPPRIEDTLLSYISSLGRTERTSNTSGRTS